MARRETLEEAQEVKESLQTRYPELEIRITESGRWGYIIQEVRACEDCGDEILTSAIGEIEIAGDFCQECKTKNYERNRQEREGAARQRQAALDEYIWRNSQEE